MRRRQSGIDARIYRELVRFEFHAHCQTFQLTLETPKGKTPLIVILQHKTDSTPKPYRYRRAENWCVNLLYGQQEHWRKADNPEQSTATALPEDGCLPHVLTTK